MSIPRAKKMWVVTIDENGQEKDGHWVDIPKPDRFKSNGLARIDGYVSKLLRSTARFASLIIATPDERMAVGLWQRDGIPEFSLHFQWRSEPERELTARQFFAERGLSTCHDYLAGNGGVPDATRCLGYHVAADAQFISSLSKDLLRQVYHLQEQDGLDFTFEEHHDAA